MIWSAKYGSHAAFQAVLPGPVLKMGSGWQADGQEYFVTADLRVGISLQANLTGLPRNCGFSASRILVHHASSYPRLHAPSYPPSHTAHLITFSIQPFDRGLGGGWKEVQREGRKGGREEGWEEAGDRELTSERLVGEHIISTARFKRGAINPHSLSPAAV